MATHSTISKLENDGSVKTIYCHWDGYIDHNGKLLKEHYYDEQKIDNLIELGNILILYKNIKPTLETHSFNTPEEDITISYYRDGDKDLKILHFENIDEYFCINVFQEYNYIWIFGEWYLANNDNITINNF